MTIANLEENVSPDDAPVKVVREAFRLNFLDVPARFNRTFFHYLLKRLGAQRDDYALEYSLNQLSANPQETGEVLRYVQNVGQLDGAFEAIERFLNSSDSIYDYQTYQIFQWLNSLGAVPLRPGLVAVARKITFDNARPSYLRAVCRIVLQNCGSVADLERLEASYGAVHEELEKAQVLVSLKRLELGRRNAFYGRVVGDGVLCARAVSLVKGNKI